MTEQTEFLVLTDEHKQAMLHEKTLQYEASIYDTTLELNLAHAASNDSAVEAQTLRLSQLRAGLAFLRAEANGGVGKHGGESRDEPPSVDGPQE